MIYRGQAVWFGSTRAPPLHLPSANCLSFSVFLCVASPAYWREKGGREGAGVEPNHSKKTWSSIKRSILSAFYRQPPSCPPARGEADASSPYKRNVPSSCSKNSKLFLLDCLYLFYLVSVQGLSIRLRVEAISNFKETKRPQLTEDLFCSLSCSAAFKEYRI